MAEEDSKGHIELFSTWTPFDLGRLCKGKGSRSRGFIGGIVGSEARDTEGDLVLQDGLTFGDFLEWGWFNWEHEPGPENVLGEPTRIYRTVDGQGNPAHGVEGFLYLEKAKAREVWNTARAMSKAKSRRRLGFSVEGDILERDPHDRKIVRKARVLHVAITSSPINPWARLEVLAKSIGYQTGARADGGAYLSALVPQSLSGVAAWSGRGEPPRKVAKNIPFSMFVDLVRYWTGARGPDAEALALDLAQSSGALRLGR